MSARMKKQDIKNSNNYSIFIREDGHVFKIPNSIFISHFKEYEITNHNKIKYAKNNIRWEAAEEPGEVFADLNMKYSKLGALVKGIRYRENLSQIKFAKKIGITQADLSKIENGKRPIGQILSNRIIKEFKLNKRLFSTKKEKLI